MSIKAMVWYLDSSDQDGPRLLALLSLAEKADEVGSCFPGISSIAKRLRRSERTAQMIIAELEADGELLVVPGAGNKVQGGYLTRYYLLSYMAANDIPVPPEHASMAAERRQTDRDNGRQGMQKRTEGVQESSPPNSADAVQNDDEGVKEVAPVYGEKRGEGLRKGVKVSAQRGEGFCMEGVKVSAPKPLLQPLLQPLVKTNMLAAEKESPEHQQWFGAICWIVHGHQDFGLLSKEDKANIGKTIKAIRGSRELYTLDDLRDWYKSVWAQKWPGKQPDKVEIQRPTLKQIKTGIGAVRQIKPPPAIGELNATHNGSYQNGTTSGKRPAYADYQPPAYDAEREAELNGW